MSKKKINNKNCCVYGCHSKASKKPHLSFHAFPKKGEMKVQIPNAFGSYGLIDKRHAWITRIKMAKPVTEHMKTCSLHFDETDYILPGIPCKKKFLKKTAVPSRNLPKVDQPKYRRQLLVKRCTLNTEQNDVEEPLQTFEPEPEIVHSIEDIDTAITLLQMSQIRISKKDFAVQVSSGDFLHQFIRLIDTKDKLVTMTGLPCFELLENMTQIFDEMYPSGKGTKLTTKERLILTFCKMKLNLSYSVLSVLFSIITSNTCRNNFIDSINKLSSVLDVCIHWHSKQTVLNNMPICFENFQIVRIVLDCTELLIEKPKCLCCRLKSYSHYYSDHTMKFLVGVSPSEVITFVSKGYGGRASDKIIFEQSGLIEKLTPHEDEIMIDKGFRIDEITGSYGIKIIRPPFLRNKKQFTEEEAEVNRKIAAARVHIERVFQRVKQFNILSERVQWNIIPKLDSIFKIACAVTNLSSPILAEDKFMK